MTCLAETDFGPAGSAAVPTLEGMVASRRLRLVYCSLSFFAECLRQGKGGRYFKVDPREGHGPLPNDARVVSISEHARFAQHQIALKVWSSQFDPVPEAAVIPEWDVWLRLVEVK